MIRSHSYTRCGSFCVMLQAMRFASPSKDKARVGRDSRHGHEMYKHIWHRSLLLLLRRTSSTSCTCMVVKTKGCGACHSAHDRPSLSTRPGMRCAGSRNKNCAFANTYASFICTYAHTHRSCTSANKTHHMSLICQHAFLRTMGHAR